MKELQQSKIALFPKWHGTITDGPESVITVPLPPVVINRIMIKYDQGYTDYMNKSIVPIFVPEHASQTEIESMFKKIGKLLEHGSCMLWLFGDEPTLYAIAQYWKNREETYFHRCNLDDDVLCRIDTYQEKVISAKKFAA